VIAESALGREAVEVLSLVPPATTARSDVVELEGKEKYIPGLLLEEEDTA
jgi:hypothetical protein